MLVAWWGWSPLHPLDVGGKAPAAAPGQDIVQAMLAIGGHKQQDKVHIDIGDMVGKTSLQGKLQSP